METRELLEKVLPGLGIDLIELESSQHGRLLRVFIDKAGGVTVDDCAFVSNHLTRLFAVEEIDFDRLEVSSPGLDRRLRTPRDFGRFRGEKANVRIRVPVDGRRRFQGTIKDSSEREFVLDVNGRIVNVAFDNLDNARLVPKISGDL